MGSNPLRHARRPPQPRPQPATAPAASAIRSSQLPNTRQPGVNAGENLRSTSTSQPRLQPNPSASTPFNQPTSSSPPHDIFPLMLLAAPAVDSSRPAFEASPLSPTDQICSTTARTAPEHIGTFVPRAVSTSSPSSSAPLQLDRFQSVTNCQCAPVCDVLTPGAGLRQQGRRRKEASTAPPVECTLPLTPGNALPQKGKGAKHASQCPGPWISALAAMPPLPLTEAKRAAAGLSAVCLNRVDQSSIKAERAARALVAILPWASACFILHDKPRIVSARDTHSTAELMVSRLSSFGVSSLEGAYSLLGRLLTWVVVNHPDADAISGSHVTAFFAACPPSATSLSALVFLRDWCGLDLPARGPAVRSFRSRPPDSSNSKESFTITIVMGLQSMAVDDECEYVRGQAAGWNFLAMGALRAEQSHSTVINAVVPHSFRGETIRVAAGSTALDKHPNPSLRRPRPVWAIVEGLERGDLPLLALKSMLSSYSDAVGILRDTDSPNGDPSRATEWLNAPLSSPSRANASLHALLTRPPISMSREEASLYEGHAAKRFLLNAAAAATGFTDHEKNEIGRFSHSTSQQHDLEPVEVMIRAHSLNASVLPAIYAGKEKFTRVLDLMCRLHSEIKAAAARLRAAPDSFPYPDGWGEGSPFRPAPA